MEREEKYGQLLFSFFTIYPLLHTALIFLQLLL
jgi:hypothetical protein